MHGRGFVHHSAESGIGNGNIQFIVDEKEIYWLDEELQTISFMDIHGIGVYFNNYAHYYLIEYLLI